MSNRCTPKYRHYKPKDLGMVVIDGRAHYLGKHGSPESLEQYHRLVADFHSGRSTHCESTPGAHWGGLTVNDLILAYARFVDGYYVKDGRPSSLPTSDSPSGPSGGSTFARSASIELSREG